MKILGIILFGLCLIAPSLSYAADSDDDKSSVVTQTAENDGSDAPVELVHRTWPARCYPDHPDRYHGYAFSSYCHDFNMHEH